MMVTRNRTYRSWPTTLARLILRGRLNETIDVTGNQVDASQNRHEVHRHLHREVHLRVPGQDHGSHEEVQRGTFHVPVSVVGRGPIERGYPQKGGATTPHEKVVPLVQFVRSLLEVLGHDERGGEEKLEAKDGHENGAALKSLFGGEEDHRVCAL